jgi:hypothetical protein
VLLSKRKDIFVPQADNALPIVHGTVVRYLPPSKQQGGKYGKGKSATPSKSEKIIIKVERIEETIQSLRDQAAKEAEKEAIQAKLPPKPVKESDKQQQQQQAAPKVKKSEYLLSLISPNDDAVFIPINDRFDKQDAYWTRFAEHRWLRNDDIITVRRFHSADFTCQTSDKIVIKNVCYNNTDPDAAAKRKKKDDQPQQQGSEPRKPKPWIFFLNFAAPQVIPNPYVDQIGCDVRARFLSLLQFAIDNNDSMLTLDRHGGKSQQQQ